jgi:hypothetical protein
MPEAVQRTIAITKIFICIDDISGYDFSGRITNPYMPEVKPFISSNEMLKIIDRFLDSVGIPRPLLSPRLFSDAAPESKPKTPVRAQKDIEVYRSESELASCRGEISTFLVHIKFRYNASWQGSFKWVEGNQSRDFRSTLDLLRMISDALYTSDAPDV